MGHGSVARGDQALTPKPSTVTLRPQQNVVSITLARDAEESVIRDRVILGTELGGSPVGGSCGSFGSSHSTYCKTKTDASVIVLHFGLWHDSCK